MEKAKRMLKRLDRQLPGQGIGALPFLAMKGERQYMTVVCNESIGLDARIDRLISMLGKVFAQNGQRKTFKPRVY